MTTLKNLPETDTKSDAYDHLIKILLVGNEGAGKTSLLYRFCEERTIESPMPSIGVDFKIRSKTVDGKFCKFQIWDAPGQVIFSYIHSILQDRFRTIVGSYFKGAHAILICYDVGNDESLESCSYWANEAKKLAHENTTVILVGNKQDIAKSEWEVNEPKCKEFAEKWDKNNYFCSAKTGYNVEDIFSLVAVYYMSNPVKPPVEKINQILDSEGEKTSEPAKELLVDQLRKNVLEFRKNGIEDLATKVKSECIEKSLDGETGHVIKDLSPEQIVPLIKILKGEGLTVKRGDCPCSKHSFDCQCPGYIAVSWGGEEETKMRRRSLRRNYATLMIQ